LASIDRRLELIYDLKQLRCFVTVGEDLHFGHAARRLNMTQPPLSRQIQMLEYELNVQLLLRTSRSVKLTPAGQAFLADARRILALAESAACAAQRVSRGEVGLIKLGFTAASSYCFLPKLLAYVKSELMDVEIELSEMVTIQQLEALRENRMDLGLVRPPVEEPGMRTIRIANERLLLAVPSSHRFAMGSPRCLKDLAGEPFITFSPVQGRYFYELLAGMFRKAGVSVKYVQHVSQVHSILALVSAGIGISIVPETARKLHFEGAELRELSDPPTFAELHLAWNAENSNPALPAFRDIVVRRFAAKLDVNRPAHVEHGLSTGARVQAN
jgi:DNA-binding transcriptional LysR family regulator